MSSICHNFTQNAWKKDLCSHCFKSKEEHNLSTVNGIKTKYISTTTTSLTNGTSKTNGISPKPQSIIKVNKKIPKSKRSVCFLKDESEVIGYGGEDWSDSEEFELSEVTEDDEIDIPPDTEEEKELQRLTKSNTDFNTVNSNLLGTSTGETRRTFTQLMLGKPLTDSDGRKQTLMVSVTPFGQESPLANNRKFVAKIPEKKLSHIPIAKNKDSIAESKTSVILTGFSKSLDHTDSSEEKSLLDEITETLEKNSVKIKNAKNELQKEVNTNGVDKNTNDDKESEFIKTKAELVFITDNSDIDHKELENNILKLTNGEPKKNGLTRQTAIKVSPERAMAYQKIKNSDRNSTEARANNKNAHLKEFNGVDEKEFKESNENIKIVEATSPILVKTEISFNCTDIKPIKNDVNKSESDSNPIDIPPKDKLVTETTTMRKVEGECNETYKMINFDRSDMIKSTAISETSKSDSNIFSIKESRELAGEPDGRADPEVSTEPPALPRSPPPISDPRPSFLHSNNGKRPPVAHKPKIPIKPNKMLQQINQTTKKVETEIMLKPQEETPSDSDKTTQITTSNPTELNTHIDEDTFEEIDISSNCTENKICIQENPYENIKEIQMKMPLSKQDSNSSDINKTPNKRKAPKPPTPTPDESLNTSYTRNNIPNGKSDSPVVREKEKRERASSCSPKLRNGSVNSNPTGESTPNLSLIPEPAPRRSLSLSQDSLAATILSEKVDDKKKSKGRFSLKKFLRMGSSKDLDKNANAPVHKKTDDIKHSTPQPKPRLVIVHPLELNGNEVEVLKSETNCNSRRSSLKDDCDASISNSSVSSNERDTPSPPRPNKPPPPPRNLEDWKDSKPCRPPPPKNSEILQQRNLSLWNHGVNIKARNPNDNIYANVGEVRASLMPSKPVRTASMREREAALEAQKRRQLSKHIQSTEHNYEAVDIRNKENVENVYDYLNGQRSSSPECDSSLNKNGLVIKNDVVRCKNVMQQRRSDGNMESSGDYCKYQGNFVRATSLPYCGSETESEIYSPYSFYGSEIDMGEDDSEWSGTTHGNRTCRLRSRKGRSIVHKNLEDNYGAVIVANHEALAQVLEHMNQAATIQPALRGLKTAPNLRWVDFSIVDGVSSINVGKRSFHTALWGAHHVTLELTREQGSMLQSNSLSLAPYSLTAVTEFSDLVPVQYLPKSCVSTNTDNLVQATIAVLPWLQVDTLQSMGHILRTKATTAQPINVEAISMSDDLVCKEACFLLLQLVNSLKCLQAQGIEELPLSLTSFVLCRDLEKDIHPRLCVLQGLAEEISRCGSSDDDRLGSLCECGLTALKLLLPKSKITPLLDDLLSKERAVSLTQVKSVLEFTLWGPSDVALSTPVKDRELALQRWLDLERATVLHGLVRTRVQLTVLEECHLLFLVRSSAKMMCEASLLLDTIQR